MKIFIVLFHIVTIGIFYTPSYEKIYSKTQNSNDIEYYLKYFEYIKDVTYNDYWKPPMQFYDEKGGDCEDFAIFIHEILVDKDYDCKIYILSKPIDEDRQPHCILTYSKSKDKGYFSNANRISSTVDIDEILKLEGYTKAKYVKWQYVRKAIQERRYYK